MEGGNVQPYINNQIPIVDSQKNAYTEVNRQMITSHLNLTLKHKYIETILLCIELKIVLKEDRQKIPNKLLSDLLLHRVQSYKAIQLDFSNFGWNLFFFKK
jgi:hypothetical protein